MDRIVTGKIASLSIAKSRVQGKREILVRVKEGDFLHYPRVSFSDTPISTGANIGKTMEEISGKRFAQLLGVDANPAAIVPALDKLVGQDVQVILKTRANPETGVEAEYADSIIFKGEVAPTLSLEEWLA